MSLSDFSEVAKARIAMKNNTGGVATIVDAWTDAMANRLRANYSKNDPDIGTTKNDLGRAVSLAVQDQTSIDGRPVSEFRSMAKALSHNVSVVTEEMLVRHWVFYGLKLPVVNGIVVTPGQKLKAGNVPAGLMSAYIIWYNNMYTLKDKASLEYYSPTSQIDAPDPSVIGVRFSSTYTNTAANMKLFMQQVGGLNKKDSSQYAEKFEVGHIESQAFIRLKVTKQGGPIYFGSFIEKIVKLHELLDIASSSLQPQYAALTASILKDTTSAGNLFVNVEMQLKDNEDPRAKRLKLLDANTNQGSGNLSRALNFVSILRDIGSTAPEYSEDSTALRQIGADAKVIEVKLKQLYDNYTNNYQTAATALLTSLPHRQNEIVTLLADISSSKTLRQHAKDKITEEVVNKLSGKSTKKQNSSFKVNHKNVPIKDFSKDIAKANSLEKEIKNLSARVVQNLNKLKAVKKKVSTATPTMPQLRDLGGRFSSLVSLQNILNQRLSGQITENMGDGTRYDILNYRTGRFANTVFVDKMSQSREGMITAFYTYMKYPYATFEPPLGAQSGTKSRDPKLLISKSIREIGATMVNNRMRAILV